MVSFIKSISLAKYQGADDTDAELATSQIVRRTATSKSDLAASKAKSTSTDASSTKRKRTEEDDTMSPSMTKVCTNSVLAPRKANGRATSPSSPTQHNFAHMSLTAAITTVNSSSPVPTPTRGKGGLANLWALTQMRGRSGTSSNGDEG